MYETIHDSIDVLASFSGQHITPLKIKWNNRDYQIKSVNLIHTAREGRKKLFYFSVSDNSNYFKLQLDGETMEWHLVETCCV